MPLRPGNWPPSHCMPPPGPIGRLRGTRSPQGDLARSLRSDIRPRKAGRPKANPQMRNDPPYKSSGRRACKGLLGRLLLLVSLLGRLPPCLAARGVAASTTTSCGDPHSLYCNDSGRLLGPAFKMPLKDVQRRTWCYPPLSGEGGVLPSTQCWQEGSKQGYPFRGHIPRRGRLHERVRGGQEVAP